MYVQIRSFGEIYLTKFVFQNCFRKFCCFDTSISFRLEQHQSQKLLVTGGIPLGLNRRDFPKNPADGFCRKPPSPDPLRLPHVLIQPRIAGVHWWQREGGLPSLVSTTSAHPPWRVCLHARCAETNFPRVSNLPTLLSQYMIL